VVTAPATARQPTEPRGSEHFEGLVEIDRWRGPLFINLRLTRTRSPIRLHTTTLIVQAQPLPQWLRAADAVSAMTVRDLDEMTAPEKQEWHTTFVEPDGRPSHLDGENAVRRVEGESV
jgi:hypothetical protein